MPLYCLLHFKQGGATIRAPLLSLQVRSRDKALHKAEQLLRRLSANASSGVQFVERSRWMTIYEETSYMVSKRSACIV